MIYLCFILWLVYSFIEGKREAHFWHHRTNSPHFENFKDIDRHPLFVIQRGLMLISLSVTTLFITTDILWTVILFIMNALVFTFMHNGSMYLERLNMSKIIHPDRPDKWVYKKGWWAQSTSSQALTTKFMTPVSRLIQFVLGIVGYIVYGFINL
jgi:hypothetical protein